MFELPAIARNLQWSPSGFWVCGSDSGELSYPAHGNQGCYALEDGSFWFRHRNACILQAMKGFPPRCPVFDIGGGNGFVAKGIQDAGMDVVLVEPGPDGVSNARQRGVRHVVRGTIQAAQFLPGSIPSAGLFDVLEHIEDDRGFLDTIHSRLQPEGRLFMTVPALQWLWSDEDVDAGHYRRYGIDGLRSLLQNSGFQVEFATSFFNFLPLPVLFFRVLPSRIGITRPASAAREHGVATPLVDRPLAWLTQRELARICKFRETHTGSSYLLVAKKIAH